MINNYNNSISYFKDYSFWILFIIFFTSGYVFFKIPFEFYFHYFILFPLTFYWIIQYGLPKFYFKVFTIPFIIGLIHIGIGNNDIFTFFKIFGGLSVTLLFFYYVFILYEFDNFKVFEIYCLACWVLCIIAFIQIISFFIGFKPGYNFSWILNKWGFVSGGIIGFRVNSILPEPTYLATSLSPAVYVSINNLFSKKNMIFSNFQSILVIVTSILTTSTIGYLGIIISIILSLDYLRLRYILIALLIAIGGYMVAYENVSDFSNRVNSAKGLWIEKDFNINNTNNSSFVLYNNLHIAKENLKKHPFFGTGLGSHESAFKKYTLTKSLIKYNFEFNIKDGNSLFVRLCTETGLVGIGFIIIMIFNGFIFKINSNKNELLKYKIISQALFVVIFLVLIRQGNYMLNGLPMIFLLYYLNGNQYRSKLNLFE